ncbi:MAG: ribosome assembly RNA-binding protein YhbY [Sandaracinaceae bacterium]
MTTELSGPARRHLRALAHHLDPVVHVGKNGVNEAVSRATQAALLDHELVKVRLPQGEREERRALADALAGATGAAEVQLLGRVLLLYRRHPQKPKIKLPRGG